MVIALILVTITIAIRAPCEAQLKQIINNFLTNPALLPMITNSGKGLNDFGMYSQCINSSANKYIMLSLQPVPSIPLYDEVGLCIPSNCTTEDLLPYRSEIANYLSAFTGALISEDMVNFIDNKKENEAFSHMTPGKYLTLSLILLMLILTIIGAICEPYQDNRLCKFLSMFSISKNAKAVLYSVNREDKNLDVLNGVRVLSMGWVILGHSYFMLLYTPLLNLADIFGDIKMVGMSTILGGTLSVDSFFCLAGFLASFSLTKMFINRKNITGTNVLIIIAKRLIRLYPMYIVVFLLIYNVLPIAASGPVYFLNRWITSNCSKHWYYNILFINNFQNSDQMCVGWTWYLANDMQFFLITIPLAILFSYSKLWAVLVSVFMMIGSHLFVFFTALVNHYPIYSSDNAVTNEAQNTLYFRPYARISTYLIGVLFSWLYLSNRDQKFSTNASNFINRVWTEKTALRYLLYVLGFSIMAFFVYIYSVFVNHEDLPEIWSALYYTFSRSCFIFGLMLIVYPITIGKGKPVGAILGHSFFNALAKITYGVYQLHLIVYSAYYLSALQGTEYSILFATSKACDVFVATYVIAFVATLLFESPIIQMEKLIFADPRRAIQKAVHNDEELVAITKTAGQ